jgi:hypothetical protein
VGKPRANLPSSTASSWWLSVRSFVLTLQEPTRRNRDGSRADSSVALVPSSDAREQMADGGRRLRIQRPIRRTVKSSGRRGRTAASPARLAASLAIGSRGRKGARLDALCLRRPGPNLRGQGERSAAGRKGERRRRRRRRRAGLGREKALVRSGSWAHACRLFGSLSPSNYPSFN